MTKRYDGFAIRMQEWALDQFHPTAVTLFARVMQHDEKTRHAAIDAVRTTDMLCKKSKKELTNFLKQLLEVTAHGE